MQYPATFAPDPSGGFVVTFRDIPEAITQGETVEEARQAAQNALVTAMEFYFEDKRPVPHPSAVQPGDVGIDLPLSISAKVHLLNEMLAQKVSASELSRRLNTSPQAVNRLVDLQHATKIDAIQSAMETLGKKLSIEVVSN